MSNHDNNDTVPDLEEVPELVSVEEPEAGPSETTRSYERPKVPITLLTGYLGAGKSTLLKYILTANHGYRIAVCMNDFGDTTDIEEKALTLSDPNSDAQSTSMLSLPNGCLCCSFKDMGIAAIEDMIAQQKDKVDWVLVELTGVADPGPIARSFWANEEMGDLLLDGIICVVDCRNILKQLSEEREGGETNEAQRQLAASDVIILNKLDLVSPEQVQHVETVARGINPTLRVHKTTKSQIDLGELFDLRAYSAPPPLTLGSSASIARDHHHDADGQCADGRCEKSTVHNSGISTILIPLPELDTAQFDRLNDFLEVLMWTSVIPGAEAGPTPEILRLKGLIKLKDGSEKVLQGVADLFEFKAVSNPSAESSSGKVVFIGRRIDDRLKDALYKHVGTA